GTAGYFTLSTSDPVGVDTALLVDNGASASPIAVFRDNGTPVVSIEDGGNIRLTNTDELNIEHASGLWSITSSVDQQFAATKFIFEDSDYTTGDLVFDKTGASAWLIGSDTTSTWAIGTTTDHTKFDTDGTVVFEGAATVHEDLNFDPDRSGGPTATRPDEVTINNCYYREFTSGNNQKCGAAAEFPHSAKLSQTIYPHLHMFLKTPGTEGTTGVTFTFYWELRSNGTLTNGNFTVSATSAELTANPVSLFKEYSTGIAGPTALGGQLALTIARTAGNAGDVVVSTYGVHYEIDQVGSRTRSSK
ncbi:hypothetical protein KJ865_13025, partial [Myxococcota bacterium]|nr:hypothetical protein [Myxococcota bacterium]